MSADAFPWLPMYVKYYVTSFRGLRHMFMECYCTIMFSLSNLPSERPCYRICPNGFHPYQINSCYVRNMNRLYYFIAVGSPTIFEKCAANFQTILDKTVGTPHAIMSCMLLHTIHKTPVPQYNVVSLRK